MSQGINYNIGQKIISLIDFFYPPFRRLLPKNIFRYGVAGVSNLLFGWVLYFILYNFVFQKQEVDLAIVAFTPHIASLVFSFPITFLSGYWLGRYVSFSETHMRKRVQMLRYLMVVVSCLVINYFCLKLFVEVFHWFPTPSQMLTTLFTTLFSYFSQRYFSFKS